MGFWEDKVRQSQPRIAVIGKTTPADYHSHAGAGGAYGHTHPWTGNHQHEDGRSVSPDYMSGRQK